MSGKVVFVQRMGMGSADFSGTVYEVVRLVDRSTPPIGTILSQGDMNQILMARRRHLRGLVAGVDYAETTIEIE